MSSNNNTARRLTVRLLALSLLSGVLASIPYLIPHCGPVALIAFIPLLLMEDLASGAGRRRVWPFYYLSFVVWNAATTFWVCNATLGGGLFAIFANAFQMALIFALFRWMKKKTSGALPYIFLAAAWIAWERFYFDAAISWPWLVLGNSLAGSIRLAQWYEYTGTLGGSLWIWTANIYIYMYARSIAKGDIAGWNIKARIAAPAGLALVILAPAAVSLAIYNRYQEKHNPVEVLVLQPNIDPYNKFGGMTQAEQNEKLLTLARSGMDSTVSLIVAPETFTADIKTNDPLSSRTVRTFTDFLSDYPGCDMIFGASTITVYPEGPRPSYLARRYGKGWYESHNSALSLNGEGKYDIYHKIKLVPGVEGMPYPKIFDPIDEKLGGVIGRCAGQDEPMALECWGTAPKTGCAVCYESVYGEFYTGYIENGAEIMTVITNDAWWGDTPGYRQHLRYASLRAIETRRSIARSANTGISALIDQKGRIVSSTGWWEEAVLRGSINRNSDITFFVRNGDITGRVCTLVFLLLGAMRLVTSVSKTRFRSENANA